MSIVLNDTDKKLEILLAGAVAANELPFVASYADYADATPAFTPGANDGVTNGATPVELVGVPGASTQRLVNNMSVFNADTAAATVTIQYEHGAAHREIVKVVLQVGYSLHFREDQWQVLNTAGAVQLTIGGVDLPDLGDYARGSIIRAGAIDWEAHAAETNHFVLVGNGTDVASKAFDWDDMGGGAGADMVHSHQAAGEGGQIDHGLALTGLSDDDHTQYLLADGTRALAGAWNMGSQALTNVNIDTGDIANAVTQAEWDVAHTHVLSAGTDHGYIDQDLQVTASPTFVGATLSGMTAGFVKSSAAGILSVAAEVALAELDSYSAGGIIQGGGSDWVVLPHPAAAGYVMISNATNGVMWDQTPAWTGLHTFNAGASIAAGQGITMADDTWIGIGAALERIVFDAAGDVSVMGAYLGVGTLTPSEMLDVEGNVTLNSNHLRWTDGHMLDDFTSSPDMGIDYRAYGYGGGWCGVHRFYTQYNAGAEVLTLRLRNGVAEWHAAADITCASFKEYSDEELLSIIDLQPRTDGIYHKSTPDSRAFPHTDFSKVHDDIAMVADVDRATDLVYSYDDKEGKYEKARLEYKAGDKYGIDFGSFVYAVAEYSVRLAARMKQSEIRRH